MFSSSIRNCLSPLDIVIRFLWLSAHVFGRRRKEPSESQIGLVARLNLGPEMMGPGQNWRIKQPMKRAAVGLIFCNGHLIPPRWFDFLSPWPTSERTAIRFVRTVKYKVDGERARKIEWLMLGRCFWGSLFKARTNVPLKERKNRIGQLAKNQRSRMIWLNLWSAVIFSLSIKYLFHYKCKNKSTSIQDPWDVLMVR